MLSEKYLQYRRKHIQFGTFHLHGCEPMQCTPSTFLSRKSGPLGEHSSGSSFPTETRGFTSACKI